MYLISGVYWDKGGRANNQDSLMLEQVRTRRGRVVLAAVCDGIGGLAKGEVASGYACEKLKGCFYEELLPILRRNKSKKRIERCICRCIYHINEGLCKYADSAKINLGTTISVLLIWKRRYLIVHLGDSRIYSIKKKKIIQITKDHRRGPNILTKCLGSFDYQMPDICNGKIKKGMGFLLCSDGFYHFLEKALLMQVLNPAEIEGGQAIQKRLKKLALYAKDSGESDNITAVYLICKKKGGAWK